ncbi:MAG: PTS transporter subunit EIIC [Selenomonas sp.]|jgi:PTS system beta-glucosides-specific IIC component|nr:PTS transporter subunit EIIC [Selenomonas sp.]
MIKGFTALLTSTGIVAAKGGTAQMLNILGDMFFYFLPIFLGLTAARKFKMNEFTGMAVGAALVYPSLSAIMKGDTLYTLFDGTLFHSAIHMEFLGLPVILMNYASSVIPIIVAIWFGSKVERNIAKIMPAMLKNFLTPFFTILIVIPLTFLVIGPVATWAGQLVGAAAMTIYNVSPVIAGLFIGAFWQVFVMFGLHWGLVPIMINNITVYGFDPLVVTYFGCSFAQIGVVLGIFLRTHDAKLKSISLPAFIAGIFGVTEPCIYGVTLPRKKYFVISCIGGAIGGALMALLSVKLFMFGGLGIFGYPTVHRSEDG